MIILITIIIKVIVIITIMITKTTTKTTTTTTTSMLLLLRENGSKLEVTNHTNLIFSLFTKVYQEENVSIPFHIKDDMILIWDLIHLHVGNCRKATVKKESDISLEIDNNSRGCGE